MKKTLVLSVILMVLMSSIVLAELKAGSKVARGDSFRGNSVPYTWEGKDVEATRGNNQVKIDGQWYFSDGSQTFNIEGREIKRDGSTNYKSTYDFVSYKDEKGEVHSNYNPDKVDKGSQERPIYTRAYNAQTDETISDINYGTRHDLTARLASSPAPEPSATPAESSTTSSPATAPESTTTAPSTSPPESDYTYSTDIGETSPATFTYDSGTLDEVDLAQVTGADLEQKQFKTREGGTVKVDNNLGEVGTTKTTTSPDGKKVEEVEYQKDGSPELVKATETIKIGGTEEKVVTDYKTEEVTVKDQKIDRTVWQDLKGKDIQRIEKDSNNNEVAIYYSDGERVTKSSDGKTYTHQQKDEKGDWQVIGKTGLEQTSDGGKKVTSDITQNGQVTGRNSVTTYNDMEVKQTYDKDEEGNFQLQSLTIEQKDQQKTTLSGDTLTNYVGKDRQDKELSREDISEISKAYNALGEDGKYEGKMGQVVSYRTEDKSYSDSPDFVMLNEYKDGKEVRSTVTYKAEPTTALIGGQEEAVEKGGTVIKETNPETGKSTITVLGANKEVQTYGDAEMSTNIYKEKGKDQYITEYKGNVYEYDSDENVILSGTSVDNSRFYAIHPTTGAYMVYDDSEQRYRPASEVYDNTGKLKPEYEGKIYTEKEKISKVPDQVNAQDLEKPGETGQKVAENQKVAKDKVAQQNGKEIKKKEEARKSPWKSGTLALATVLGKYRSNAELSNLLFTKAGLYDWREDVDRVFARNYLGKPYIVSAVCQSYWDVESESTAAIETPDGLVQFIGHVEGDRSPPEPVVCATSQDCADLTNLPTAKCQNQVCVDSNKKIIQQYFYKITYGVRAPSDEKLTPHKDERGAISFNIVVKGPSGIKPLYSEYIELFNGQTKNDYFVQYSANNYHQVCIWFGKKPKTIDYKAGPGFNQQELREEICNSFIETDKSKVNFVSNPGQTPESPSSTTTLTI